MPDLPLGVSTWTTNAVLKTQLYDIIDAGQPCPPEHEEAVRGYFEELSDLTLKSEIRSVELWHSPILRSDPAREPLGRLVEAGIIGSMHGPFRDLSSPDETDRRESVQAYSSTAELLSQYGGEVLVAHGSMHYDNPDENRDRLRRSAESVREIASRCEDLGISIAVELLVPPQVGFDSGQLLELLEMADMPNVGVCIDVNHVFPPSAIVPTIQALGPHILTLHISDYDGVAEKHWLPMEGVIDWQALVEALREVKYTGPFLYETRFEAESLRAAVSRLEENYREIMGR